MTVKSHKKQPVNRLSNDLSPARQGALVRLILSAHEDTLSSLPSGLLGTSDISESVSHALIPDNEFSITGSADVSKVAEFDADNLTAGTNTFALPTIVTSDTFAVLGIAQTFTGVNTFSGGISLGLTAGSVVFSDGTTLTEDNSNLFWDDGNNRLGIGTTTPNTSLDVVGDTRTSNNFAIFRSPYHLTFTLDTPTQENIVIFPNVMNSRVVVLGYGADPAPTGEVAIVNKTGQTAAIAGPVLLTNGAPAGMYHVFAYMECTANGGVATPFLRLTWTDSAGTQTAQPLASVTMTSGKYGTGFQEVHLASGDIGWEVGNYGSGIYNVRIRCVYLGNVI